METALGSPKTLEERLEILETKIRNPEFRTGGGKANEVNYWVFDYDPRREMEVRRGIEDIRRKLDGLVPLQIFDLYDMMIDYLEEKHFLDKVYQMETKKGLPAVSRAINHTLRMSNDANGLSENRLVEYLKEKADPRSVLFLTGIGKCYPILRAQEIFNQVFYNMPKEFMATPMILFYPGIYTEQELRIFGEMHEGNYYRAFRIVR